MSEMTNEEAFELLKSLSQSEAGNIKSDNFKFVVTVMCWPEFEHTESIIKVAKQSVAYIKALRKQNKHLLAKLGKIEADAVEDFKNSDRFMANTDKSYGLGFRAGWNAHDSGSEQQLKRSEQIIRDANSLLSQPKQEKVVIKNNLLKDLPLFETMDQAIEAAAEHLPDGYILNIKIEKHGYGVELETPKTETISLDGGDGMRSDIYVGILKANGVDDYV